jgi:hypothetical protein
MIIESAKGAGSLVYRLFDNTVIAFDRAGLTKTTRNLWIVDFLHGILNEHVRCGTAALPSMFNADLLLIVSIRSVTQVMHIRNFIYGFCKIVKLPSPYSGIDLSSLIIVIFFTV